MMDTTRGDPTEKPTTLPDFYHISDTVHKASRTKIVGNKIQFVVKVSSKLCIRKFLWEKKNNNIISMCSYKKVSSSSSTVFITQRLILL